MRQRLAVVATLLVFGVGVAAIAVVGRGADGRGSPAGDLPKLGVPGSNAGATAMMAERDALVAPGTFEYRVAGQLTDPGRAGPAYRLGARGGERGVVELARALGIDGDVETSALEWSVVEGRRGLHVSRQPGLPWWFSTEDMSKAAQDCGPEAAVSSDGSTEGCWAEHPAGGSGGGASSSAGSAGSAEPAAAEPDSTEPSPRCEMPPCREGQACIQSCPEPDPGTKPADGGASSSASPQPKRPADLPTAGEAEAIARRLLERTGVDLDGVTLRADDGFDRWYVTVERRVGGLRALGLESNVGVGPRGEVLSANGHLAVPELLGDYPLVGVDGGLERLRAGYAFGMMSLGADDQRAIASDPAVSGPAGGAEPAECPPMSSCLPVEPGMPGEPAPPIVRTITGVSLGLLFTGEHLVPAYLYDIEDGGWEPVVAVEERYLEPLATDVGRPEPAPAVDR